jgi:hypothetical protein
MAGSLLANSFMRPTSVSVNWFNQTSVVVRDDRMPATATAHITNPLFHLLVSIFSFLKSLSLSAVCRPLVSCPPIRFYPDSAFRCHSSLRLVLYSLSCRPCLHRPLHRLQMGRKCSVEDYERTAEKAGYPGPMKRRIAYSKRSGDRNPVTSCQHSARWSV